MGIVGADEAYRAWRATPEGARELRELYYDLKHVRASLDLFVQGLGFESILSEKGNIAYSYDRPLDQSCYAEVSTADMFVLLLGGRYGSAASDQAQPPNDKFYERYDSITRREYERAAELDIPRIHPG